MKIPYFIHAQIHQGQLIGIVKDETSFTFHIFSPSSVLDADRHYPDLDTALNAAIEQAQREARWSAGFWAAAQGEPLPDIADCDFICGWHDGCEADGRAA